MNFESRYVLILRKIKNILTKIFPSRLIKPLTKFTTKKVYTAPKKLNKRLKKELFNTYFSKDVVQFETLIDKDLSIWK